MKLRPELRLGTPSPAICGNGSPAHDRVAFADTAGLDALQPIANRVAPAIDDVVHSLSPEEVEILLTEAATSGRILGAGHLGGGGDAEHRVIQ
jgi:hypothetical protein